MGAFFFDYGLFAAKAITVIIAILLLVAGFVVILASRQKETESIEIEKINDKFDAMKAALEEELLTKEEIKQNKKERKKKAKEEEKAAKKRLKSEEPQDVKPRIFVLRFVGDLHASEVDNMREAITAILTIAKEEDEIFACIDSPGGLVHSYGLAASQLSRFRKRNIPLTVSVDYVAASGGYLMAAVANKIIAAPFAVVGSIGVLAQVPNLHRFLEKHNVDIEQHTAGEYKTTLTLLGRNTDKARSKFKEELEETHILFKQYVHEYRPQLDIEKVATGEHWYGKQAIDLKLIDELMTSDDYLLNKSETADIFEVNYVINETFADKVSSFLHGFTSKLASKVMSSIQRVQI